MTITLANPVEKTITPAVIQTLTTLTINRVVDLPQEKIVRVFIQELGNPTILWSGADYDVIGQWTDKDVEDRLNVLFSA